MSESSEYRRFWRAQWLRSIQEFADGGSQRRLWLDPTNTNPHFSFTECVCCYFDDLGLSEGGYGKAIKDNLLRSDKLAAIIEFHHAAESYKSPTDDYDHEAILADPIWAEVVALAKRAQAALLVLIQDPSERSILMEP